jgi:hypothetical protein
MNRGDLSKTNQRSVMGFFEALNKIERFTANAVAINSKTQTKINTFLK